MFFTDVFKVSLERGALISNQATNCSIVLHMETVYAY